MITQISRSIRIHSHEHFGFHNYIIVAVENEYDNTGDEGWLEVEVVDPIFDNMGMEVIMMFDIHAN